MRVHTLQLDHVPACWRPAIRLISVLAGLLLAVPVFAQNPSNITIGTTAWPAVISAPDPTWNTGGDGIHDQRAQVNSGVYTTGWGGAQNQIAWNLFAVPNASTGTWLASTRFRAYTGHVSNQYVAGYELGVEGQYNFSTGVEGVNRFFLWDFKNNAGVFSYDNIYKTFSFQSNVWTNKSIDAPNGWVSAKALRIYSNIGMGCDASNKGVVNYAAGASGVKDTVQVCAKDAANVWAWRTLY